MCALELELILKQYWSYLIQNPDVRWLSVSDHIDSENEMRNLPWAVAIH